MTITEPQMNADERRYNPVTAFAHKNSVTEFSKTPSCKEKPRCGTRMTRIGRIFTDTINPCVSVSFVLSVFYRMVSASICALLWLAESNHSPQRTQRRALPIFAPFALFAVRSINCLHRIFAIGQPFVFICVHPRLINGAPARKPAGAGVA